MHNYRKELQVVDISDWAAAAKLVIETARGNQNTHNSAAIVTLSGDLGAGKTTLVQYLARELGIANYITSPTFVIMQKYNIPESAEQSGLESGVCWKYLVHIDAYRLEGETPENIAALKLGQYFADPENIVCIEWAEYIPGLLPADRIMVHISHTTGESRKVEISTS